MHTVPLSAADGQERVDRPTATINAIGTAVPDHDIHAAFVGWATDRLADRRERALFARMAARSGIGGRWSVLPPTPAGGSPVAEGGFYQVAPLPSTAARMALYADHAPALALAAIGRLGPLGAITHLVVASCTGFVAPGIDQIIAARLGLDGGVERTLIGFMGCYAAVTALRTAHHIVRSEPAARVLVVTVELSTLHLQPDAALEPLLAMLQFGDGAAAAIVSADAPGLALSAPFAATLPASDELIRWRIGDQGFAMHLSGEVPGRIGEALRDSALVTRLFGDPAAVDGWAVHAGGRSILDAVQAALGLDETALSASRSVLARFGNMSSATLMFVLADMLAGARVDNGVAVAFGPGLAAEGFRFRHIG
ncbi:type III polyketide synthase [Sphingomonas solaris]|uniref:Type III polyketide synthase n=1 Tax=Alterirhizorhabdus solaris TaxID=2529389 RepID=A0A558R7M6_9SPHN|nr:type III polyketide synthase [Sphingomonas solaris]TVV75393.1 type III polyketide synthase [Sphingomonas solaris]